MLHSLSVNATKPEEQAEEVQTVDVSQTVLVLTYLSVRPVKVGIWRFGRISFWTVILRKWVRSMNT